MAASGVTQTVKGLKERLGGRPVNPSDLAVARVYSFQAVQLLFQALKTSLDIRLDGFGGIFSLLELVSGDVFVEFDVAV